MKIALYVTDQSGKRIEKTLEEKMEYVNTDIIEEQGHPGDIESHILNIHSDIEFQTFGGIGGAFSDTSATVWIEMPDDKK